MSGRECAKSLRVFQLYVSESNAEISAPEPGAQAPSASGPDFEITPAGARHQAGTVARVRGIDRSRVDALIAAHIEGALLGFIGELRVNVLDLNLALDAMR